MKKIRILPAAVFALAVAFAAFPKTYSEPTAYIQKDSATCLLGPRPPICKSSGPYICIIQGQAFFHLDTEDGEACLFPYRMEFEQQK